MPYANDLDRLAAEFGTDKGTVTGTLSPKGYTIPYYRALAPLRDEPIRLLEIGISKGASLKMWEAFFPNACIYGIDIKPECKQYEQGRVEVFIGSQTDQAFLESVIEQVGEPFDVIIDDGGHRMEQHRASLEVLFPALASGGLYAIEDLHTAYWPPYGGGYRNPNSTVEVLKHLIDHINDASRLTRHGSWLRKWWAGAHKVKSSPLPNVTDRLVSVQFFRSLTFLYAK